MATKCHDQPEGDDFAKHVEGQASGFLGEYWYFLRHTRKFWLAPVIFIILILGVLVVLGSSGAAPFIYTLF